MAIVPVGLSWFVLADMSSCKLSHCKQLCKLWDFRRLALLHEAVAMNLADRRPLEMWDRGC